MRGPNNTALQGHHRKVMQLLLDCLVHVKLLMQMHTTQMMLGAREASVMNIRSSSHSQCPLASCAKSAIAVLIYIVLG